MEIINFDEIFFKNPENSSGKNSITKKSLNLEFICIEM